MPLFDAIVSANHRAASGQNVELTPPQFSNELPIAALTCIDARLNKLLPGALGIEEHNFIWLRNAGNIITGPLSSTMRSLALACAVKGAKEIAVIGHTDCLVCKSDVMKLMERFRALGVERSKLPENLVEYFGLFASERQNVIKACDYIRQSPLIGAKIPVHGLVIDIQSGRLEWIVNGYQTLGSFASGASSSEEMKPALAEFKFGEMKFPEMKIGDIASASKELLEEAQQVVEAKIVAKASAAAEKIKEHFQPKIVPPSAPPPLIQPKPPLPKNKRR